VVVATVVAVATVSIPPEAASGAVLLTLATPAKDVENQLQCKAVDVLQLLVPEQFFDQGHLEAEDLDDHLLMSCCRHCMRTQGGKLCWNHQMTHFWKPTANAAQPSIGFCTLVIQHPSPCNLCGPQDTSRLLKVLLAS